MIKSAIRFSAWVVFAALFCFAPSSIAQVRAGADLTGANHTALSSGDHQRVHPTGGIARNDGWGNQGGGDGWGGGGGWGGGWGGGGNGNGGGGVPVPEGGTTLMYLALTGLSCFGAMAIRARQRANVSQNQ
jgi:hypothetical protein